MKRICLMVVLFVSVFTSISLADSSIVEYTSPYINQRWVCEMFDTQMNADAQAAFSHRLLPGDQIICGLEMLYYDHRHLDEPFVKDILMAVKREESMLLFAAKSKSGDWETSIESDSFLPVNGEFEMTVSPEHSGNGSMEVEARPYFSIVSGNEAWMVVVGSDAKVRINSYTHKLDDNTSILLEMILLRMKQTFALQYLKMGNV